MRATQTTTFRSLQNYLDKTSTRLQTLQLAAATGKKLNRPSDDPSAISPVLSARTQIKNSNRYLETIASGLDRVNNMDGNLENIENVMQRIREISLASINDTLTATDRLTYANEVTQLKQELIDTGNAQVDGKFLFAGFAEKTKPFTVNPNYPATQPNPVNYNGDQGVMQFEIGPGELVDVNITGTALLMGDADNDGATDAGAVDVFAVVTAIEEALRANSAAGVDAQLTNLETGADQVRTQRSLKGNIGKRLELASEHMEQIKIDMESMRSRFEDADILETITSLEQQQQGFQAALSITGRVNELSILDYI